MGHRIGNTMATSCLFILSVIIMDIVFATLTSIPPSLGSCQDFHSRIHTLPTVAHMLHATPGSRHGAHRKRIIILTPG